MSQTFIFMSAGTVMALAWALAMAQPPVKTETQSNFRNLASIHAR